MAATEGHIARYQYEQGFHRSAKYSEMGKLHVQ